MEAVISVKRFQFKMRTEIYSLRAVTLKKNKWTEHFETVLNKAVPPAGIPAAEGDVDTERGEITIEVKEAIRQ